MCVCESLSHVQIFATPWTGGSFIHGIFQARILEWVAIHFSRASFSPMDQTQVPCTASRFFTIWATREAQVDLNWGQFSLDNSGDIFVC